jgi:hypothetical protein
VLAPLTVIVAVSVPDETDPSPMLVGDAMPPLSVSPAIRLQGRIALSNRSAGVVEERRSQ